MIVVADTSPLLHLSRVGRLDLVQAALGPVTIPRTVWAELIRPGTRADVRASLLDAAWMSLVDDPPIVALGLDPGETAAILLAEQLHADALLIDERRGRSVATARGLRVIGTLANRPERVSRCPQSLPHAKPPPTPHGAGGGLRLTTRATN